MRKSELLEAELHLLPVLAALLELRSSTLAAERLGISQPAVSRALARLRLRFGDQLFVKGARGLLPTARAEAMASPVAAVLVAAAALFSPATPFDPAREERVFRIATTDYGALAVLPGLLPGLMRDAPGVGVEVAPLTRDAIRGIAAGEFDFLLYGDDDLPPACRTRVLFEDGYACMMREGHPAALDGVANLDAYCVAPHVLVTLFGGRRGVVDEALKAQGRVRRIAAFVPTFSLAPMLLACSDLILTLPTRAAAAYAGRSGLVTLPPPVDLPPFIYRLVWHERAQDDPASAWLRARIVAASGVSCQ